MDMKTPGLIFIAALILCIACENDNFELGDCNGKNCIQASGYVYDQLTEEPLSSAAIKIVYKENCGWCGTGCPFREFEIGTIDTDDHGFFQTSFSTKEYGDIMGSYVFEIEYEDFISETVWISNDGQTELFFETYLSPPAYLNLSIDLQGKENVEYFGLNLLADSLSGRSIGDYNSGVDGLFSDTTLSFTVPAERMVYFGYLIRANSGEKYSNGSTSIKKYETKDLAIVE